MSADINWLSYLFYLLFIVSFIIRAPCWLLTCDIKIFTLHVHTYIDRHSCLVFFIWQCMQFSVYCSLEYSFNSRNSVHWENLNSSLFKMTPECDYNAAAMHFQLTLMYRTTHPWTKQAQSHPHFFSLSYSIPKVAICVSWKEHISLTMVDNIVSRIPANAACLYSIVLMFHSEYTTFILQWIIAGLTQPMTQLMMYS